MKQLFKAGLVVALLALGTACGSAAVPPSPERQVTGPQPVANPVVSQPETPSPGPAQAAPDQETLDADAWQNFANAISVAPTLPPLAAEDFLRAPATSPASAARESSYYRPTPTPFRGASGRAGSSFRPSSANPSSSRVKVSDVSRQANGVTTTFVVPNTPIADRNRDGAVNGLDLTLGGSVSGYSVVSVNARTGAVTLSSPPPAGATVLITYTY